MHKRYILILVCFILFARCTTKPQSAATMPVLNEYYQSKDISISRTVNTLEIKVGNSGLVDNKRQKMGDRWVNAEALASVGAVAMVPHLDSSFLGIDSVAMYIQVKENYEKYTYNVDELKKVNEYQQVSESFIDAITSKSYSDARLFLSDAIIEELNDGQLLYSVFPKRTVVKKELIGVKTVENIASLYITVYYDGNIAQTYMFTFYLSGDNKIEGINAPKG